MRALVLFSSLLCAVQCGDIMIKVIQEAHIGNCGYGCSQCNGESDATTVDVGELQQQMDQLEAQVAAAQESQAAVASADSTVDDLASAVSARKRRHRRQSPANTVSFTSCEDASQTISGTIEDVILQILDAIKAILDAVSGGTVDSTKLNCYIDLAKNLTDGLTNNIYTKPNATNIMLKINSVKSSVSAANSSIATAIDSLEQQIEDTQNAIASAGGDGNNQSPNTTTTTAPSTTTTGSTTTSTGPTTTNTGSSTTTKGSTTTNTGSSTTTTGSTTTNTGSTTTNTGSTTTNTGSTTTNTGSTTTTTGSTTTTTGSTTTTTGSTTTNTGSTTTNTGSTTTNTGSSTTTSASTTTTAPTTTTSASTTTTAPTTTTSASTTTTAPTTTTTKAQNTCDYSQFGASHTMLLPPKDTCKIGSRGVTEEEKAVILKVHNDFRNKVAKGEETQGDPGPQPAGANIRELVWNDQLAEVAQAWAEQCKMGHDDGDNRKICNRNYFFVGQNIYYSYNFDDASEWTKGITAWYNEVKDMPSSIVNSFSSAPSGKVIGHYTQVVWAETNEIGCGGIVYSTDLEGTTYPKSKIYVCNYGEGGNILGRRMYVTGPAASQCGDKGVSTTYTGLCN